MPEQQAPTPFLLQGYICLQEGIPRVLARLPPPSPPLSTTGLRCRAQRSGVVHPGCVAAHPGSALHSVRSGRPGRDEGNDGPPPGHCQRTPSIAQVSALPAACPPLSTLSGAGVLKGYAQRDDG